MEIFHGTATECHLPYAGFPLFYWKKIQDFSRTFQDPRRNFPGPLQSPQMLTYKEKWGKTFTHTVQSMGMGKRCPPPQPTRESGGASLAPPAGSGAEPRQKRFFPGLSRTKVIFQDFPGPGFFKKKSSTFQDFPEGMGTLHMGSHSITHYQTQVNTPHLNPSHAGWYSIYLFQRDGRLSWLDTALARPGVEPATFRSRVQSSTNAITETTEMFTA